MHRNVLITLSLTLILLLGCAGEESPTEQAAAHADTATAATETSNAHNSRNSLDWPGTYSGVVPCASCPGIETRITLHADGQYDRSMLYLEEGGAPVKDSGSFVWNDAGSKVTIGSDNDVQQYQVGENQLFHLDVSGERISGELAEQYILGKLMHDAAIEGKRWKLVELRGKAIEASKAALLLNAKDSTVSGNASCNSFTGSYTIKNGQRISFDLNMAITMMACADPEAEAAFLEMLQQVDNYAVGQDGTLSLNRARMAPLARFAPDAES